MTYVGFLRHPSQAQRTPRAKAGDATTLGVPEQKQVFSVRSQAVLLTYQGFSADLAVFLPTQERFVAFVEAKTKAWGVA